MLSKNQGKNVRAKVSDRNNRGQRNKRQKKKFKEKHILLIVSLTVVFPK